MIKSLHAKDRILLEGIAKGDPQCIAQIYDAVLPAVIHWVGQNQGSESDARDVFQEGILALYRRVRQGEFELTCTLKSYLLVVCRNLWLNQLRRRRPTTLINDDIDREVAFDAGIHQAMEATERGRLFVRHFGQLGADCREILRAFFAKTPLRQIAEQRGTSEGYIKKKKFQCKERLLRAVQADPLFKELQ